jgi:hypothetical protein
VGTLNLGVIRNLVRQDLNETGTTMLSDAELNKIINDGYKDASAKGLCYESKITKDNIAIEKIVSLKGSNVIRVNYVEYKTGTTEGGKGMLAIMPQAVGYVPINTSSPQHWFQWGDYLIIEPIPDVATYDLAVYATCYPSTVLSADGDLPSALPTEFAECVYLFALSFACLKLRRWTDAALAYNKYIADVQRKRVEYISKHVDVRAFHELPESVTMEEPDGKRG